MELTVFIGKKGALAIEGQRKRKEMMYKRAKKLLREAKRAAVHIATRGGGEVVREGDKGLLG